MMTKPTLSSADFMVHPSSGRAYRVTVLGRQRWALECLMAGSPKGCTPFLNPAPRWAAHIHGLRAVGVEIETISSSMTDRSPEAMPVAVCARMSGPLAWRRTRNAGSSYRPPPPPYWSLTRTGRAGGCSRLLGGMQMTGDAQTLTAALRGRWHGSYGTACCPAHGDRSPSLSLSTAPDGRLLMRCYTGCTFLAILDALRGLGLMEGTGRTPRLDSARLAQREAEEWRKTEKRARQARTAWEEARPIKGTPAEFYLRGRGITCSLPDTLRFHPAAWHPSAQRLPALVARVEGAERFAVHRTYLLSDGRDKATVEPPKAMLGSVKGGAVRLTHGAGPLVVCEGIETALSLASGLLRGPAMIWAALSTSGVQALVLPPRPGRLTVATDGDSAGRKVGHALATRADALGWTVSLLPAPEGRDWNDIITMRKART